MINTIGEMAGLIWKTLEEKGEMTTSKLKTDLKADVFTLNAAIGWLAREGKVEILKKGNSMKLQLLK